MQRPAVYGGRQFVQRTYYVRGVPSVRVYRPYRWGGVVLNVWTPVRYYPLVYYNWVYTPWYRPVPYTWLWLGRPWYAYYRPYFTPYPIYASPTLWLTDYLLATTLQEAYEDRIAAGSALSPAGAAPVTPGVKQAIALEVRRLLETQKTEQAALNAPTPFGAADTHIFVVSEPLETVSPTGACTLSEGDVIQLAGVPQPGAMEASVFVLASKGGDCRRGGMVPVGLAELQEMQNHMRATIERGLGDLRAQQGKNGIPALPEDAAAPAVDAPFAADLKPDTGETGTDE